MNVVLRPPTDADAAAIAQLLSARAPEAVTEATVRRAWSSPGVDRERDDRVAISEGGDVVGWAGVHDLGERHEKFWVYVRGEPVQALLDWAEQRVAEVASRAARIFAGDWDGNDTLIAALEAAGFRLVRHSYRMAIDLDGDVPQPLWPPGIDVRTFRPGDERTVYEVHQETFEDTWEHVRASYEEWAHSMLGRPEFDASLWFLALDGSDLAGIALCRRDDTDDATGWVSILGVRREWRGRGLGKALLAHSFGAFRRRGFRRVVLGVDAESSTGAHKLYERAGMRVVKRHDIYEKEVP